MIYTDFRVLVKCEEGKLGRSMALGVSLTIYLRNLAE